MTRLARRRVLTGLAAAPLAGFSLATVLANPDLARAAAQGLDDVSLTTKAGKRVGGALAVPAAAPAPAILLVHEWWGLNDQIKAVAAELAREGYLALAVDLYDGKVATTRDGARGLMQAVDGGEATDTVASWIAWLRAHKKASGKIGTIGWCFGGGWSLNASIAAAVDATVVYYGRVNRTAADLKALQGPVLGHFATRDKRIDGKMVGGFEKAMAEAGKSATSHWYEAEHAFANPTSARYDKEDARLAWKRTLAFFNKNL